jgi:hypothetical protein
MSLHRRELEILCYLRVGQLARFVERAALDPLGRQRARGNRRAAAKCHKTSIYNDSLFDTNLQLHHITACRRTHETSTNRLVLLVEFAYITR